MAQLATAQFITDTWFATGLTPTVTINEALTGNLVGTFPMTETSDWNYIYYRNDGSDNTVYFFKYDSWIDNTINRYMWNNNKVETVVNVRGGGWSVTYNNQISKEKMKEIAEMVVEMLPEQKEIVLDTSKIEKKLVVIEDKIELKDIEIDYDIILDWQKENTQKIIKKVENIKFPKQDDKKVLNAIEWVKSIVAKIEQIDIMEMKEHTKKIKTKKEEKEEELNEIEEEKLWYKILKESEREDEEIIEKIIEDEIIFSSLLEEDGGNS